MQILANPQTPSFPQNSSGPAMISSDFQTFLRMLTAQVQNQDPLNPMESGDFAVQLATFSGVEQQVRSNDLLAGVKQQLSQTSFAQMSAWLGQEARVSAPVNFHGEPEDIFVELPVGVDAAELLVYSQSGQIVQRLPMLQGGTYEWAGLEEDGTPLPEGQYSFELLTYFEDQAVAGPPVQTYALITEVQQTAAGVVLSLVSGAEVAAEQVTSLRRPAV